MEYFGKYDDCPMSPTNCSIDRPLIYVGGFTMPELGFGVVLVVGGFYTVSLFLDSWLWLSGILLIVLGYFVPQWLKEYRVHYPPNSILHKIWLMNWIKGNYFRAAKGVFGP